MSEMKNGFVVNVEKIIVGLLLEERKYYVDVNRIERLCDYIKDRIRIGNDFRKYGTIVFDVNEDAIYRLAQYRKDVFELEGGRIYLKCEHNKIKTKEENKLLVEMIKDFCVVN